MWAGIRFLWSATRGHRFAPWESPYLRWRLETYSGLHAEDITLRDFAQFSWSERKQIFRFLRWAKELQKSQPVFHESDSHEAAE